MSSRLFNGTTFTFNSSLVGGIVGLDVKVGGNWIEVTMPEDLNKLYEVSPQPDLEIRLRFRGCHNLVYGAKGTAAIVFSNGYSRTCPGTWQVGPCDFPGAQDAPWESSAELRPTVA